MTTENPTNKRDIPVKRANKTLTKARNRCQTRINRPPTCLHTHSSLSILTSINPVLTISPLLPDPALTYSGEGFTGYTEVRGYHMQGDTVDQIRE